MGWNWTLVGLGYLKVRPKIRKLKMLEKDKGKAKVKEKVKAKAKVVGVTLMQVTKILLVKKPRKKCETKIVCLNYMQVV